MFLLCIEYKTMVCDNVSGGRKMKKTSFLGDWNVKYRIQYVKILRLGIFLEIWNFVIILGLSAITILQELVLEIEIDCPTLVTPWSPYALYFCRNICFMSEYLRNNPWFQKEGDPCSSKISCLTVHSFFCSKIATIYYT